MTRKPITELRRLRGIDKTSGNICTKDTRCDCGRSTWCRHVTMLVLSLLMSWVRAGVCMLLLLVLLIMKELLGHEPELAEIHIEIMTD